MEERGGRYWRERREASEIGRGRREESERGQSGREVNSICI